MTRCYYCYKELKEGEIGFHRSCLKKMFNDTICPVIDFQHADLKKLAEEIIRSQTTLTGVQAKLSLDIVSESKEKRFTIVGLWGRYILKPQTEIYANLPEIEDLTMHLAEISGIEVVPHTLIPIADGQLCYLTRRIDRLNDGYKLAMEDMCQLSERLTEYKYKGSYEQIAKLITKYSSVPKLDVIKFWEIVLFSWLVGNSDMHLKNFSLQETINGDYVLSPAYDLLNTSIHVNDEDFALQNGLIPKSEYSEVYSKTSHPCKDDFITFGNRIGVVQKKLYSTIEMFATEQEKVYELIENSFLEEKVKRMYKQSYIERLHRFQRSDK